MYFNVHAFLWLKMRMLCLCKIPSIHWQLTTERVLTMEFCDGGFITDTEYIHANNISIDDVGALLLLHNLSCSMHGISYRYCTFVIMAQPIAGYIFDRIYIIWVEHSLQVTFLDLWLVSMTWSVLQCRNVLIIFCNHYQVMKQCHWCDTLF